jgi:hypothetical protein
LTVCVNLTESEVVDDYWQFLLGESQDPEGSAWTYDGNFSTTCETLTNLGSGVAYGSGLLRSNSPTEEVFEVWASFKEAAPTPKPSGLGVGAIAAITVGSVAVLAGIVVVVLCLTRAGSEGHYLGMDPEPEVEV